MFPFDYDKLRLLLIMRGMTVAGAARDLGVSESYFYNAKDRDGISSNVMQLMAMKYGITQEDIKKDELKQEPKEQDNPSIDPQQLHDVINCASYQALRTIVRDKESQEILEEIMFRAFARALKEG